MEKTQVTTLGKSAWEANKQAEIYIFCFMLIDYA